ncbi:hypothetical protein EW146_g1858 [Bondarzewia mesenterica]|uniref:Cytochrome P450 n=1 Tax=Bondarzewia mesenterica TaxID=1095465 RepID=A0A4S4M2L6_9AGAM|nr:hypothetical protein EW146_g1858 [Bondarzewia mesenterica]
MSSIIVLISGVALLFALARYCLRGTQDVNALPSPVSNGAVVFLSCIAEWLINVLRACLLALQPVDEATWIWGHEKQVFDHESNEMYIKWVSLLGPLYRIKAALLHKDIIVAADNAAVQHIFQNPDKYVKSPVFRPPVANLMGRGLVWAEGDDHKKQRRILAPAFSQENIKGMSDDIWEGAEKLESILTNQILSHNGGMTVNILEQVSKCMLDIIGRVAFGHDFNSGQSTEAGEIAASWHNHVNMGLTFGGFIAPLLVRSFPWIVKLPIPALQAQGTTKMIVTKLAMRILERDGREGGYGKDILSLLLNAQKLEKGPAEGLTPSQIVENVIISFPINTFIMVGHETTAGSVSFTLLQLARNPGMQQKLREEIQALGHDLDYNNIQKLDYLDAVVKEGLRLHPASPHTERVVLEDDIIPLSTPIRTSDGRKRTSLRVKAGQTNLEVWGSDAHKFKPERWTTLGGVPPPNELPHGWSGLVAFCDGPRMCIGYRLAILEFKIMLATLVRSIEFRETEAQIRQMISPTLQPVVDGRGGVLPLKLSLVSQH